jgi:hypothetical protein
MKVSRSLVLAFVAAAAVVTASCSDSGMPTAPAASRASGAPEAGLLGTLTQTVQGLLLQCTPLREYSATQTIGPAGGTMVIGPHTFTVPRGALSAPVTITADAPSDNVNRVVFEPEGLRFRQSASLTMSYANCHGLGMLLPKHVAYTNDLLQILYLVTSIDNLGARQVTGQIDHFSDYAIAW